MNNTEKEFLNDYYKLHPFLRLFAEHVQKVINTYTELLPSKERLQITYSPRIKDDDSIIKKAFYRQKKYSCHLKEITDKVGIRYVLLSTEDVNFISEKITENNLSWDFVPSCTKKYLEDIFNNPNIFDYQSNHFVVKPKSDFFVDSDVDIDYITCEIQIRTILQHAYSEVSHDSVYKGRFSHDRELIRILSRSMALIESTDDNFEIVYDKMKDKKRPYICFSHWLLIKYVTYDSTFKKESYMTDLVDKLLITYPEVIDERDEISRFENEFKSYIGPAIQKREELLFKQPASILAMYLAKNKRGDIKEKWPYSNFLLETIFDTLCIPRES
ncbi:MAG: RelA/SpoT domain-containing protein [Bacteroidales bacterium]|jgi:ppGpp synthetase/RelA/SpoT-type nucleotidyltranferase